MVLCWGSTPTLHPLELWFLEPAKNPSAREILKRSGNAYFKAFGYALKFVTQVLFCTWLSKLMGPGRADVSRRQPHH